MDELPVSQNHRYTPEQLEQYLAHVKFPSAFPHAIGTLEHLTELIHRQLAYVPFESLALHYSDSHHLLSLDPERLFAKIVTNNRGRGGYCMETNTFFASVLGAMGYEVMHVGGRVSHATGGMGGGGYMGW